MKLLLTHRVYPGQFRNLIRFLSQDSRHQLAYLAYNQHEEPDSSVKVLNYQPSRTVPPDTLYCMNYTENAVLFGQAAWRSATMLQQQGFEPDVILSHSGWGQSLYLQDVFKQATILCYFEWFYRAHGSSHGFHPKIPVTTEAEMQLRTKNMTILMDLAACKAGVSPTEWQQRQFPTEYRDKIEVIHDGVDTEYFAPEPAGLYLPRLGLDLRGKSKLVTYVATGMEPMRGFPEFMQAVSRLQRQCPDCQVVVVGADRTEYSNPLASGKTYRQLMLELYPFDLSRLHFTGPLSRDEYRQVIRASMVHVYLTFPFILSWSMLEAMACGCLVVGSATPTVQEVLKHGENGLLVEFFDVNKLCDTVAAVLEAPATFDNLRANARETIIQKYEAQAMLKRQWKFVQQGRNDL